MTPVWRMYYLGVVPSAWAHCWDGWCWGSRPQKSSQRHSSWVAKSSLLLVAGASHGGEITILPLRPTFPWCLLPKSLLFPGIEGFGMCAWGWGWGQNLLSGQGLKSFMYLIPKLEESGKLRAKLTGPWTQLPRPRASWGWRFSHLQLCRHGTAYCSGESLWAGCAEPGPLCINNASLPHVLYQNQGQHLCTERAQSTIELTC